MSEREQLGVALPPAARPWLILILILDYDPDQNRGSWLWRPPLQGEDSTFWTPLEDLSNLNLTDRSGKS